MIACGALARELNALLRRPGLDHLTLTCLPATLHNRPELIPGEVERVIGELGPQFERIYVAYADCGTGGLLDELLQRLGIARLPGPHCYASFAGQAEFATLANDEPGSFYLTDFLVRQFDTLVVKALGLDAHPELRDAFFGNYQRLVHLVQNPALDLDAEARRAAEFLQLDYERVETGYGELAKFIEDAAKDRTHGTENHRLLAGYSSPSDHQTGTPDGQAATRRALRASYRPRRHARQTNRHRRLS